MSPTERHAVYLIPLKDTSMPEYSTDFPRRRTIMALNVDE
jgi:hypothetical protein